MFLEAPPAVGPAPSSTARFVLAVTELAPGVSSTVSAVVTNDVGATVASFPSTTTAVFTLADLTPGVPYTLRASCVDALGGTCIEVVHRWQTPECPSPIVDAPFAVQSLGLSPGVRYVSWTSPQAASAFEYSVDGSPWLPVPWIHPGLTPQGVLVRAPPARVPWL